MIEPNIWNQLLIWPILNVLIALYKIFESLGAPGPLGFAIITMTVVMRLILWPLMQAQMVSAKKMQNLKPHLDELTRKHKDDKTALQKAQLELYQQHGVNPAAGCLPMLVQLPVLIAIYNVFNALLQGINTDELIKTINTVLYAPQLHLDRFDATFFGFDLLTKPGEWQSKGWWLMVIPIATAGLQWYQTKLMLPSAPSQGATVKPTNEPATKKSKKHAASALATTEAPKKEEKSQEDMAADMQKQMAIISPLMFGYFAFQFPVGLALYWNIYSLFGIIHQQRVNALHG